MAYSGRYKPLFPEKYRGNINQITWRSSWELKFMSDIDKLTDVIEWSSEELIIPYSDPVSGRVRRYFPDFKLKIRQPDGSIKTVVVEIKPRQQITGPRPQARKTKRYITEVYTYAVNQSKWKAAEKFCTSRGWEFITMDEYDLGLVNG